MAANGYYKNHGRNYFCDLVQVYDIIGLTAWHGEAVATASLTPKKENEIVIISHTASDDFYQLLYFTIRGESV